MEVNSVVSHLKYGVNLLTYDSSGYDTFRPKVAEGIFNNLRRLGYDGVELIGIPERMKELKPQKELLSSYQLEPVVITGAWGVFGAVVNTYPNKDPTSSDPVRRVNAIEYIGKCSEMAAEFGAPYMLVALGPLDRPVDTSTKGIVRARRNLVEVLKKSSRLAADYGVKLLMEPQCRFEGYYGVNSTVEQTLDVIRETNADNVVLMFDTFHASIEETSIPKAIRNGRKLLAHVHSTDSNRLAPGFGTMDFKPILRELQEAGYRGYLGLECMPAGPDPDGQVEQGLRYLKSMEALSAAQIGRS
jgi:sugar phosphate isomerase/epimerase